MDKATLKMYGFVRWDVNGKMYYRKKVIKEYLSHKPVSDWGFKEFYLNALLAA